MKAAGAISVWREMLVRSWRVDPRASVMVGLLTVAQVGTFTLTAIAIRAIVEQAERGDTSGLLFPAFLGGFAFALWGIGAYVQFELRSDIADRIGFLELDAEVQRTTAELEGLEHLERSDYLDRLNMLRGKGQSLVKVGWWVPETAALAGQVVVTLILLATVHPAMLLLAFFAAPAVLLSRTAYRRVGAAALASAENTRLERHLHEVTTRAAAGKEVRVCGAADTLIRRAELAWREAGRLQIAARVRAAMLAGASSLLFVVGYAATLVFAVYLTAQGRASIGDLVLVVILAGQLRAEFAEVQHLFTHVLSGFVLAKPYRWLLDHARARRPAPQRAPAPTRLRQDIRLREVTFQYPGSPRTVLGPLDIDLPAGSMVALVGEHGSGKSTLVKLLCKFYQPTSGTVSVDGVDLQDIDTRGWRAVTSAAFQDFARYEVPLRHAVGFGDVPALADDDRLRAAIRQADAEEMVRKLSDGLDTQLGVQFGGVDLSEGQWQKVALARTCMRQEPLLVVLDEPTASLDAPSEHAIFLRHASLARRLGRELGTVTLVVSHRFSTVRMADLILVMKDGRIVEHGSHDELIATAGAYAELYEIHHRAYAV